MKKEKVIVLIVSVLILISVAIGLTYAFYGVPVNGNEQASSIRVQAAVLELTYSDSLVIESHDVYSGWSSTKTISVENTGEDAADYTIIWRDLLNTFINDEIVISATCISNVSGRTCPGIPETPVAYASTEVHDIFITTPINIVVNEKHTYTITVRWKELASNQNYNQNKSFRGTINIAGALSTDTDCFTTSGTTALTITGYTCSYTDVVIPSTINGKSVTSIGENAFKNKSLTSVMIPSSVTTIGNNAFQTNQLHSLVLSNSITSIGNYAFNGNQLVSVKLPNSLTSINQYAFASNQLTSVTLPSNLTTIGTYAFQNNQLQMITLLNSVTSLGTYAFSSNQLSHVVLSGGLTTISNYAFSSNQIESLEIPSSVTSIGQYAFASNSQLTSVEFPNSLTTIGNYAFSSCGLTTLNLPSSVTTLGNYTFYGNQLKMLRIPNTVTSMGTSTFRNNQLTSVKIGTGLTAINAYDFYQNYLTTVTIPSNILTLGHDAFNGGDNAHKKLTSVIIEGKTSTSGFTGGYGENIWGWASGYSDSNIVWN